MDVKGINIEALGLKGAEQLKGAAKAEKGKTNLKDGLSKEEMKSIDKNKDGYITEAEFKAAMGSSQTDSRQLWQSYLGAFSQKMQQENKTASEKFDAAGNMTEYSVSKKDSSGNLETMKQTGSAGAQQTLVRYGNSKEANTAAKISKNEETAGDMEVFTDEKSGRVRAVQSNMPPVDISGITYLYTAKETTRFDSITINGTTYKGDNLSRNGDVVSVKDSEGTTIAQITIGSDRQISKISMGSADSPDKFIEINLDKTGKPELVQYKEARGADFESVQAFDDWTNSTKAEDIQYVKKGNTEAETAANVLEFAKDYINKFGNNDNNLSLTEFIDFNKNAGLGNEDLEAIFNMINLNGSADGITADEFASYLMAIDIADAIDEQTGEVKEGKILTADGSMTLENYNTYGAQIPVFAMNKYSALGELHEQGKDGLEIMNFLMQSFHEQYFSDSTNIKPSEKTYNYKGQLAREVINNSQGVSADQTIIDYKYDDNGKLYSKTTSHKEGAFSMIYEAVENTETYSYHDNGQIKEKTITLANGAYYKETCDENGSITGRDYSIDILTKENPIAEFPNGVKIENKYDSFGELYSRSVTYPDGSIERESMISKQEINSRLENTQLNMGALFNIFVPEGQQKIPQFALKQLMTLLAAETNLSLNFANNQGSKWVEDNFQNLSPEHRESIKSALNGFNGIANNKPDQTLTLHDIGNLQYAAVILAGVPEHMTAENIRTIQTIIDKNTLNGTNNKQAAEEIAVQLKGKVDLSAADIEKILNKGDTDNDSRLYNNQPVNARNALTASAGSIKAEPHVYDSENGYGYGEYNKSEWNEKLNELKNLRSKEERISMKETLINKLIELDLEPEAVKEILEGIKEALKQALQNDFINNYDYYADISDLKNEWSSYNQEAKEIAEKAGAEYKIDENLGIRD